MKSCFLFLHPKKRKVGPVSPSSIKRYFKKERRGAIPVPGPTKITGVLNQLNTWDRLEKTNYLFLVSNLLYLLILVF